MDELVKRVVQKTGISETAARQAVEIVVEFLKQKLPAPLAGQIDAALGSSAKLSDVTKGLKDILKNS